MQPPSHRSNMRFTWEENGGLESASPSTPFVVVARSSSVPTVAPNATSADNEQGMGGPVGVVAGMLLLLVLMVLAKPVKLPQAAPPQRFRPYQSVGNRGNRQLYDSSSSDDDENEETAEMRAARIEAALAVQRVISVIRDVTTLGAMESSESSDATRSARSTPSCDYAAFDEATITTKKSIPAVASTQSLLALTKSTSSDHDDYAIMSNDDTTTDAKTGSIAGTPNSAIDVDNINNPMTCCCICLETYQVGDVVAWSSSRSRRKSRRSRASREPETDLTLEVSETPNSSATTTATSSRSISSCLHVFHKQCIVQWLQTPTHDDCPSCRTVLLEPPIPVPTLSASRSLDEADEMDENDAYDTEEGIELPESALYPHGTLDGGTPPGMANATSPTTSPLAFVIVNGLIARVRQNRRHRQLQRQEQQQLPSSPTKAAASTIS